MARGYIGLRHPTLLPGNERFISPARDISYLAYPVVKGALQAIEKDQADKERLEGMCRLAAALGQLFSDAVSSKTPIPELLSMCRQAFEAEGLETSGPLAIELLFGFLTAFGLGCRESTTTDVLSDEAMATAVGQASVLSALPAELREQVIERLVLRRLYCKELDRPPLTGKIERNQDDGNENSGKG
jgi:hypothetical protein